ncbi:hypothetical protein LZ31DRAFT_273635 [Colletotrichum somersetense]|nr:hypothetical protein LZ31DRAFT_273635 [Colletotrichum somersetense]
MMDLKICDPIFHLPMTAARQPPSFSYQLYLVTYSAIPAQQCAVTRRARRSSITALAGLPPRKRSSLTTTPNHSTRVVTLHNDCKQGWGDSSPCSLLRHGCIFMSHAPPAVFPPLGSGPQPCVPCVVRRPGKKKKKKGKKRGKKEGKKQTRGSLVRLANGTNHDVCIKYRMYFYFVAIGFHIQTSRKGGYRNPADKQTTKENLKMMQSSKQHTSTGWALRTRNRCLMRSIQGRRAFPFSAWRLALALRDTHAIGSP